MKNQIYYHFLDMHSFNQTSKWIDDVRSHRGRDAMIVLVGNKKDLGERRLITTIDSIKKKYY